MESKEILSLDLGADERTSFVHTLCITNEFKRTSDYWQRLNSIWNSYYHTSVSSLIINPVSPKEVQYDTKIHGIVPRERLAEIHISVWTDLQNLYNLNRQSENPVTIHRIVERSLPESFSEKPSHNIISKMGVELEGGWTEAPMGWKGDGSVSIPHIDHLLTGEIAMPPFAPEDFPWEEEADFPRYPSFAPNARSSFMKLYPNRINHTCGMHVHYSFPSLGMYSVFVDHRFPSWLNAGLKQWGKIAGVKSKAFWSRLEGANSFCKNRYVPENIHGNGDRYTAVNYCYFSHQTMEIRVLPMFKDPRWAMKAIKALTRLINLWGCAMSPKEGGSFRLITTTCEFN